MLGVQGLGLLLQNSSDSPNAFCTPWRTLVNVGLRQRECLCVVRAIRITAARALGLGQHCINLRCYARQDQQRFNHGKKIPENRPEKLRLAVFRSFFSIRLFARASARRALGQ